MIQIEIFRTRENKIYSFRLTGHAGYASEGADIVCSAVTILVFNTVNCIEKLTKEAFTVDLDEKNGGYLHFQIPAVKNGKDCHDASLLLEAMANGLEEIKNEYSGTIKLDDKEV